MDLSVTNNTWHRRQYGTVDGSVGHKKKRGAEDNMVQFMDLSVTNNTWDRRQYGTVDGSVGHKKELGQKTIWYSLWIYRSQIIRGTEDNMVQFMELSVIKNTWGRRQYGTVYGSVGHKKYVGQKTIWYSWWICRSQKKTWGRRQYGTVYGSIGHK